MHLLRTLLFLIRWLVREPFLLRLMAAAWMRLHSQVHVGEIWQLAESVVREDCRWSVFCVGLLTRLEITVYISFWLQRSLTGLEWSPFLLLLLSKPQDAKTIQYGSTLQYCVPMLCKAPSWWQASNSYSVYKTTQKSPPPGSFLYILPPYFSPSIGVNPSPPSPPGHLCILLGHVLCTVL